MIPIIKIFLKKYSRSFLFVILAFFTQIPLLSSLSAQDQQYMFKTISKKHGLSNNNVSISLRDSKGFMWFGTANGLNRYDGYSFKIFEYKQDDTNSIQNSDITALAEDYNGNIWIGAGVNLDIYNPITESITHTKSIFGGKLPFLINSKWKLHKDRFGNYWYNSSKEGLFKYYVSKDSLIQVINIRESEGENNIDHLTDISEDSDGNIYTVNYKGDILKISNNQPNLIDTLYKIESSLNNFFLLFIDSDDDIWCYDKNNNFSGVAFISKQTRKIEYISDKSKDFKISTNLVTDIIQDNDGKIWILADHGGINIFDKEMMTMQYLRNDPLDDRSIAENNLKHAYKDKEGIIWLGSFKSGICYYHKDLYKFNHVKFTFESKNSGKPNDIDNFTEDKNGDLWIGTNGAGLIHYNRENGNSKQYIHNASDPNSISADIIVGLTTDRKGNIWIGTYFGGLNKWDGKKFVSYKHNPLDPTSITDDRIWDICEDSEGLLWVATLLGGVNVFDPNTGKVIKVFKGYGDNNINTIVIFSIREDSKGLIWFCTDGGLRCYNKTTEKFKYYDYNAENPSGISDRITLDLIEDSRGIMWVATANGLSILDDSTDQFITLTKKNGLADNRIMTILEDNNNDIWVSTTEGLSRVIIDITEENKYTFKITNYDYLDGLQGKEFNEKAAFKTSKGELLFGGSNGFNIFYPNNIKTNSNKPNIVFTDFQVFNKSYTNKDLLNGRIIFTNSISFTEEIVLNYSENVFSIEFSNINYFHPERFRYQYQLEGFNNTWNETSSSSRNVTYTNLNPGTYNFHVRVSNSDGSWNPETASMKFIVQPPWWKKIWFRLTFILGFVSLFVSIYYYRTHQLEVQKNILETTVLKRTNELSSLNTVLSERQEKISLQNEELNLHREKLEKLIGERTIELEKALLKAEESDHLKSAFLANMSHEIRTPMNAIFGFAHLLSDGDITKEEIDEYSSIIQKNCSSLLVIINDILDISKIESNQVDIKKSEFDICIMFNDLLNYYKLKANDFVEIIYEKTNDTDSFVIIHDQVRIKQVVQNLIDNAIKFTESGYIKFGFFVSSNNLSIYVEDTGKGIAEVDHEKIFIPFQKAEISDYKIVNGAGLGLSICKRIAQFIQGEIYVDSTLGKGTRFTFSFPTEIVSSIQSSNPPKPMHDSSINNNDDNLYNFEILVAEDEPANYKYLEKIFVKKKIKVNWAKNGQEAIDFVNSNPEKKIIILMDIKMPVLNGIEAFKTIKSINEQIPIIALTAYAYEGEKVEILKNDFNAYVSKPFQPKLLFETLEKVTGQKLG